MIPCTYCDGYNDKDMLNCPFDEIYNDFIGAIFESPWTIVMPDRFILTRIDIGGYIDDVILFSLNLINHDYISYFGHEIKIDTYKNIHKGAYSLLNDKTFARMFPPIDCFYAHGVELKL